jgi:hypothetical protein
MKKLVVVYLFLFTVVCLQAQTLSWSIGFFRVKTPETLQINRPIRLETGEEALITITPITDCFAYILLYDIEENFVVGHNGSLKGGEEKSLGIKIDGPPGTERLYVIMSLSRQTRLESLIQAYNNNGNNQNIINLRNEIASLQEQVSLLGEPAIKFEATGATMRGQTDESTFFSDKDTYVRTITISH